MTTAIASSADITSEVVRLCVGPFPVLLVQFKGVPRREPWVCAPLRGQDADADRRCSGPRLHLGHAKRMTTLLDLTNKVVGEESHVRWDCSDRSPGVKEHEEIKRPREGTLMLERLRPHA